VTNFLYGNVSVIAVPEHGSSLAILRGHEAIMTIQSVTQSRTWITSQLHGWRLTDSANNQEPVLVHLWFTHELNRRRTDVSRISWLVGGCIMSRLTEACAWMISDIRHDENRLDVG
jgi:hypothetical protein